jgi:hypothetical protein
MPDDIVPPVEPPKEPPKEPETPVTPPVTPVDDIPEKFKGKSASEVAKSYLELEKKLGDGDKTAKEKQELADEVIKWRELGQYIEKDPELVKNIELSIKKQRGITDEPAEPEDDTKIALRDDKINNFEKKYAIDTLEPEKRQEMHKRIGEQVRILVDPSGKTTYQEAVKKIPVSQLQNYLETAYKVSTVDDEKERSRLQGMIEARQNGEGVVGSIPSSAGKSDTITLTPEQRKVAQKLGITEEKYATQLKKMQLN